LAKEQPDSEAMRSILGKLRLLPPPASDDPRIDLLEATVLPSLPEAEKLAVRAANRASDLHADMTRADAKAREGHIALLAGELDRAARALLISKQIYSNFGMRLRLLDVLHDIYLVKWLRGASWSELDEELNLSRRVAQELGGASPELLRDLFDRVERAWWSGDLPGMFLEIDRWAQEMDRAGFPRRAFRSMWEEYVTGGPKRAVSIIDERLKFWSLDSASRAKSLVEKGNFLLALGDFEASQSALMEALESSEALGAKPVLGNAWVGLAAVALEERRFSDAERWAKAALDIFAKQLIALSEPAAHIALARVFLAQDRRGEARREIDLAAEFAYRHGHHREQLEAAILSARLNAASKKKADADKALRALKKVRSDAVELKLKYQEFLARQAMAEIKIAARLPEGEADLAALKQEADKLGYGLFTR